MSCKLQQFNNINFKKIAEAINKTGYIVIENALPEELFNELYLRITSLNTNELHDAKVGQGSASKKLMEIRNDKTCWLDYEQKTDQKYLFFMDTLRKQLNKHLFLGLFEYECHYAVYEVGSYYKKHSDVLGNVSGSRLNKNRILSSVLYLNKNWGNLSGGELVLYDKDGSSVLKTIYPDNGCLVLFLSEEFPHEVKSAKQIRYSIAGWFRVNKQTQ